jgi:Sortilin, neurotensin receptor 3,
MRSLLLTFALLLAVSMTAGAASLAPEYCLNEQGQSITMHEHALDASPRAFYWLPPTYEVVFILSSKGGMMRSDNEGASWQDQSKQLGMAPYASGPLPTPLNPQEAREQHGTSCRELYELQQPPQGVQDAGVSSAVTHHWENPTHSDLLSSPDLALRAAHLDERASVPRVSAIYRDADPNRIYVMQRAVTYMWRSADQGATYERLRLPFYVTSLLPHPVNANWLLATGLEKYNSTHVDGFLSVDGGFTWSRPLTYVWRLTWGSYDEEHASDFFVLRQVRLR